MDKVDKNKTSVLFKVDKEIYNILKVYCINNGIKLQFLLPDLLESAILNFTRTDKKD